MRSGGLGPGLETQTSRTVLPSVCMCEWAVFTQPTVFGREWWAAGVVQLLSGLGWRVMEEKLAEGRGGRGTARWRCFHLDISQILPMCICATAMATFLEMVHEFICIYFH